MSTARELSTTLVTLSDLRLDGGTQSRAQLSQATIDEYAELYASKTLPPIVVFYDGESHWLADGFHRVHGARQAGREILPAEVHQGSQRDAILYSVGANATHGLPRSNADKRRAVELLLRDEEWSKRSDRWIAERCCVDHKTVSARREALGNFPNEATRTTKDGREYPAQRKPTAAPETPPPADTPDGFEEPAQDSAAPAAQHWWVCPVCSENFNLESSRRQGWVNRGHCGDCDGHQHAQEPLRPAPSLAKLRAIHAEREEDHELSSWINVQKQLQENLPSREMRAALFVLQGGDMALLHLGLSWRCTAEELKQAFRDGVRAAHPDRGGTQQEFLDLQRSRELVAQFLGVSP